MPSGSYLSGQIIFNVLISLALVVVMIAVATLVYGLPIRLFALWSMFCYTLLGVFAFTAIALSLTRVITSAEMASTVGPFAAITLSFTSGVFLPPDLMPHWLTSASSYLPLEPLAQSMQSVLGNANSGGFDPRTYAVLIAWGVAGFAIAIFTFSWQPQRV